MMEDYDIVIIGAGLAGLSLACALDALDYSVALVEARPLRQQTQLNIDDARSLALSYRSVEIFNALSLWPVLKPHATPIRGVHMSQKGCWGTTTLTPECLGASALGAVVPAMVLAETLLEAAKATKTVFYQPATLSEIHLRDNRRELRLNTEKGCVTLRARLVIAADGTHSMTRSLAGFPKEEHDYAQSALVANITVSKPHHGMAYERLTDAGVLALLPCHAHRMGVVLTVPAKTVETWGAYSDEAYLQHIQELFGRRLGVFSEISTRSVYPIKRMLMPNTAADRLVWVGNAAHTLHPVAAQGFNVGLRDVFDLFQCLSKQSDPGHYPALKAFAHQRGLDVHRVMKMTEQAAKSIGTNHVFKKVWHAKALCAIDNVPFLKRWMTQWGMGTLGRRVL